MKNGSKRIQSACNRIALLCGGILLLQPFSAVAQEAAAPAKTAVYYNPLFVGLSVIIVLLLAVIVTLANVVKAAADHRISEEKEKKKTTGIPKTPVMLIIALFLSHSLHAQDAAQVAGAAGDYWGLSPFTFYLLLTIIGFEAFILWGLYRTAMQLLGVTEKKERERAARAAVKQVPLLEKINASVSIEQEAEIMLDHSYDGIRELDNDLPPWWKYGFYVTIVFAVIYLLNYHVLHTGKLQLAEYQDQLMAAKHDMEEYRKKAANLVDENNATLLTDAASLATGKEIFINNCSPCHGHNGEGGVGPNLTDDYWLHKGGIKDIFRTIKLGWPEKGMKSWQQDLSAQQIHEVASYVKSLHGTNPPNAKEKQGELFMDNASDSTRTVTADTTKIVAK